MKKIIVIGSSNVDMVVRTSHLPAPGETILGGEFFMNQGGKGANQAVAIKRLGGNLIFMAKLGNDVLGRQSVGYFKKEGIDTRYIALDEDSASGVALISVDDHAENSIVVASGANMLLNEQDVDKMLEEMCEGDILLMQLEIPLQTVEYAARKAFGKGVKVVLNPAPARSLPKELFRHLYMVTPNRIEAEMLTGIKIANDADVEKVAEEICAMGVHFHRFIFYVDIRCFIILYHRKFKRCFYLFLCSHCTYKNSSVSSAPCENRKHSCMYNRICQFYLCTFVYFFFYTTSVFF